jgi:hypothetical protein
MRSVAVGGSSSVRGIGPRESAFAVDGEPGVETVILAFGKVEMGDRQFT